MGNNKINTSFNNKNRKNTRNPQDGTEHSFVPYEQKDNFEELENEEDVLTEFMSQTERNEFQNSWLTSPASSSIISTTVLPLMILILPFMFY